jgi:methylenetetrahydrofolate--tRNA-(uracil-5-)-methyltransferase
MQTHAHEQRVLVIGAGLAGCEAAWQLARRGVAVRLFEMRPAHTTPAHAGADFAELVCSNSLRSAALGNAVGLLKEELRRAGSLVMRAADASAVPAGSALAVDRVAFARAITDAIESHPAIEVRRERVAKLPDDPWVVLATGPLTDPELAAELVARVGEASLYFYDAISPVVYADSVDAAVAFRASRWERGAEGEGDYWNLALDRAGYEGFVDALLAAETVPLHPFEKALYFEGCLPIEEMARRGRDTLAHGPMKPVGITDPRTGRRPHAVVQLRHEDRAGRLYNLVGFQTKMRIADQQRVLRSLPGLGDAVFARYGSVHRNTYLNAPRQLAPTLELRARPGLFVAGQMAGVEGYLESAALGGLAGIFAAAAVQGRPTPFPPSTTAHAALLRHLGEADPDRFQPMNVNWGLFPPLDESGHESQKSPEGKPASGGAVGAGARSEPQASEVQEDGNEPSNRFGSSASKADDPKSPRSTSHSPHAVRRPTRRQLKNLAMANRALTDLNAWLKAIA